MRKMRWFSRVITQDFLRLEIGDQLIEFAWIKRKGFNRHENVALCDDGANGNLKPRSEYTAEHKVERRWKRSPLLHLYVPLLLRFFALDLECC